MTSYGLGDEFSIIVAFAFLILGLTFRVENRSFSRVVALLGSGLSFGSLALICLSPFTQLLDRYAGLQVNLFEVAVREGKASLWLGSTIACLYLIRDVFVSSTPGQPPSPHADD